jgi:thiamine kinase-like enzyme
MMEAFSPETLAGYAARVPELAESGVAGALRLGGLTNLNYLIVSSGQRYVMRVPGDGTERYIDRRVEAIAARSASAAGVNIDIVFFDESDGLMVTRFVDGSTTMSPAGFAADTGALKRAAAVLHRLHTTAEQFANDFQVFPTLEEYKSLLIAKGFVFPDGWAEAEAIGASTQAALEANPVALVPAHCDPLCENFIDTGDRMFLIDFEYSGNYDPMWDLGDFSVEGSFTAEQDAALLRAYFGGEPPASQVGRMTAHKALCDLFWAAWSWLQHVNGNPVDDFLVYGTGRYERCMRLMKSEGFPGHIASIAT